MVFDVDGLDLAKAAKLLDEGRIAEALRLLNAAEIEMPNNVRVTIKLVELYTRASAFLEAAQLATRLLVAQPDNVHLLDQVAILYLKAGLPSKSVELYENSIRNGIDGVNIRYNLAWYSEKSGNFLKALEVYQSLIPLDENNKEEVITNVALIQANHLCQYESAIATLERIVGSGTNYIPAIYNLAGLYEQGGEREKASTMFLKVLNLNPTHYPSLIRLIDLKEVSSFNDPVVQKIGSAVDENLMEDSDHVDALYALAKVSDALGEYERSAMLLARANQHNRRLLPTYNVALDVNRLDQMLSIFNTEFYRENLSVSDDSPVFICGMFRSGSTLLERILEMNGDAVSVGENEFFYNIFEKSGLPIKDIVTSCKNKGLDSIAEEYRSVHRKALGDKVNFIDKRPENIQYLGLIKAVFPKAKILITHRNPVDNCLAVYSLRLGRTMNYSTSIESIFQYYQVMEKYRDYWVQLFPQDVLVCDYDELVISPAQVLKNITQFLGMSYSDKMLDFHKSKRAVKTASVWQVRQPIYTRSSGRWKNYVDYIPELKRVSEVCN